MRQLFLFPRLKRQLLIAQHIVEHLGACTELWLFGNREAWYALCYQFELLNFKHIS